MMKKLLTATAISLALLTWHTSCSQQPKSPGVFTPIKVETPARPAGQEDVTQLITPKIDTVRVEKSQEILKNAGLPKVASYSGEEDAWKKLCEQNDIDPDYSWGRI